MNRTSPPFFLPLIIGLKVFFKGFLQIAAFELVYKCLTNLLVKPFLSFILGILLSMSGTGLAFNEQILGFAFSIPGLFAGIIVIGLSSVLVYFEFAVVISIALQVQDDKSPHLSLAVSRAIWSFKSLRNPWILFFSLYALVLLPIMNIGVTSSLLPELSIPNFITGELTKTTAGEWLLLLVFILFLVVFFALLFVIPSMVVDHNNFYQSVKKSLAAIRTYGLKMLGIFVVFFGIWSLLFILPRMLNDFIFNMPNVTLLEALNFFGFSTRTPAMFLLWVILSLMQVVLMPMLLTILSAYYAQVGTPKDADMVTITKIESGLDSLMGRLQAFLTRLGEVIVQLFAKIKRSGIIGRHKRIFIALALVLVAYIVYAIVFLTPKTHGPYVVGHRGSAYAVENTLEAYQAAIDAGVDYVEIDIMLSKDNVPVIYHDTNLKRLTGYNMNIYELTAQELQSLTLSQNGFTGQIPTFEEVLELCDGQVQLAVELKLHGEETENLVDITMEYLSRYEYQKDCFVFSMNYDLVSQLVEAYPDQQSGYCVYTNIGQINRSRLGRMGITHLVVEESMVSKNLVNICRKADVVLLVWTVNDSANMEEYLSLGVSGVITDYPQEAVYIRERLGLTPEKIQVEPADPAALEPGKPVPAFKKSS